MKLFFLASAFLFLITGCSTLPEEMCAQPDWHRIGKIDGQNGELARKYHKHLKTCERTENTEEEALYLKGWNEGIVEFCTPENGYKVGMMSMASGEACNKKTYPEFAEQFNLGRSVSELRHERSQVRDEIDKEQEEEQSKSIGGKVISYIFGDSNRLESKDKELTEKINLLENNAPTNIRGKNEAQLMMSKYGDSTYNYTGAFVGSFVGFGLGHAIQGRYAKDGWKWTAGEVGTLGVMIATTKDCSTTNTNGVSNTQCNSVNGWALVGWLAFRVWQGYDLFHYANKKGNMYAMPTGNGVIIGYQF